MTTHPGRNALIAAAIALAIVGCDKKAADVETPAPAPAPAASAPAPAGPTVEPAAPAPAPTAQPEGAATAATPLDSQPGLKGSTWDLTKAKVAGNILTVQFTVKASPDDSLYESRQRIEEVALIDDATSQRYSVLKDDTGKPMASPINTEGTAVQLAQASGMTGAVWFKFPAPPATSETISIVVPEVGSFDGIKVQR